MPFGSISTRVNSINSTVENVAMLEYRDTYWNYYSNFEVAEESLLSQDILTYYFDINPEVFSANSISYKSNEYDAFRLQMFSTKISVNFKDNIDHEISLLQPNSFKLVNKWTIDKQGRINSVSQKNIIFNVNKQSNDYRLQDFLNYDLDHKDFSMHLTYRISSSNFNISLDEKQTTQKLIKIRSKLGINESNNLDISSNQGYDFIHCYEDCNINLSLLIDLTIDKIKYSFIYNNTYYVRGINSLVSRIQLDYSPERFGVEKSFKKIKIF